MEANLLRAQKDEDRAAESRARAELNGLRTERNHRQQVGHAIALIISGNHTLAKEGKEQLKRCGTLPLLGQREHHLKIERIAKDALAAHGEQIQGNTESCIDSVERDHVRKQPFEIPEKAPVSSLADVKLVREEQIKEREGNVKGREEKLKEGEEKLKEGEGTLKVGEENLMEREKTFTELSDRLITHSRVANCRSRT
ncbi:hypothetical protein EJ08DRAFT_387200 [Tothia fuscella]|uniref:Uncharacterized protein n=1 Tax=Tothia fuscella TaxID=1048955 RepID=A0A9P4P1M3_9PEZI|nr:hypothetical protein EJ08DRAFT_387200 [Tothia fuscella]